MEPLNVDWMGKPERRVLPMEFRVEADEGTPSKIIWYPAVFDRWSENLGFFKEIIRQGAFTNTLKDADIRALFNHDCNFVLGRNKSGTLRLSEDDTGLSAEVAIPDAQWARDLVASIKRGDISQGSFGFQVVSDRWGTEEELPVRELLQVNLMDVSIVTFPAYPDADGAQVRSAFTEAGLNYESLSRILFRAQRGLQLGSADHELIRTSIDVLQRYLPPEPRLEPKTEEREARVDHLALFLKRLAIAERAI